MAEGQDWDLYAIVRSCTSASTHRNGSSNTSENLENPFECLASLTFDDDDDQEFNPFSFPNLAVQPTNNDGLQELQDSYKPFLPSYTASGLQENLSNDVWAWRKYGQKPIKGSPYPRNYYRCSSSKGCAARKQVERSNTDPNMFIVSYTGDHTHPRPTHRNSLAGSTRNKVQQAVQKPEEKESEQPNISADKGLCSSPLSATSLSPRTPLSAPIDHAETAGNDQETKIENLEGGHGLMGSDDDCDNDINDDCDDDLLIPNMALNEDFIKGFQELVGASEGGGGGSSK
ncbi:hypothetical protein POTOM_054362 [Populus tomentosa]|uniref:WRKY domain-containing protein n=1 Tax=Populus tomentosa TaxID=118781 RepID=A0A8X7XZ21_POPTO|nr:hypothetical protein POTOM_055549 [Populus tomentosa]KAG6743408.1 hypothetical protein POTOM_054362 [Populus tomentosa]